MRARSVLFSIALLVGLVSCVGSEQTYIRPAPRIPLVIRLELHAETPVFPHRRAVMKGMHVVSLTPTSDEMTARLELTEAYYTEGVEFDLIAHRNDAAPLDTRYLSAVHFGAVESTLSLDGVEYRGAVEVFEVDIDVLHGIVYGELSIRFEPVEGTGEAVMVGADLAGYTESICIIEEGERGSRPTVNMLAHIAENVDMSDDPAACVEIFEALRSTPDDPNGPPPPYNLDDTIEGGGGSVPVLDFGADGG